MDDDFEEAPQPTDLAHVAALARKLLAQRARVEDAERALADAKHELRALEESELPLAMLDIGLEEFALTGGSRLRLKTEHLGNISLERQAAVFKWMEENGHGALIKRTLTTTFGKGDKESAESLVALIKEKYRGAKLADKLAVHHSTLAAFIREKVADGTFVEGSEGFQLFNIYVRRSIEMLAGDGKLTGAREDEAF